MTWSESPWSGWQLTEGHSMLLGTVVAQGFVFPNLLYEEGAIIKYSVNFSNSARISVNLTSINFEDKQMQSGRVALPL